MWEEIEKLPWWLPIVLNFHAWSLFLEISLDFSKWVSPPTLRTCGTSLVLYHNLSLSVFPILTKTITLK